jgi:hypothetical protein
MIIDSIEEYNKFITDHISDDLILHCVGIDPKYHPAVDSPCLFLVKSISSGMCFCISIAHPDALFNVDKQSLISDINRITGKKWTFDKKQMLHYFNFRDLYDINLSYYLETGDIVDVDDFNSSCHKVCYNKYSNFFCLNQVIPMTIHIEKFDAVSDSVLFKLKNISVDSVFLKLNGRVLDNLYYLETSGLKISQDLFREHFGDRVIKNKNEYVYTEYNIYTATGRPSNRYGGINYAALKKDDGTRETFISRHGQDGTLFLIDYSAYHPHLIAKLIDYKLPTDAYRYLGQYYFNTTELTDDNVKDSKLITFQLLYGNIPVEYKEIPYFNKLSIYIDYQWKFFQTHGYIETPLFKRRITKNNIVDASPTKLFNYIIQAVETEYNMEVLTDIKVYLKDKLTVPVLYTYDAILFDVNKNDGFEVLLQLKKLMEINNFPVKCYSGFNYSEMTLISL